MISTIFVDIDGVLNSIQEYHLYRTCSINKHRLKLLKSLIEQTNSLVVLSSSWRISSRTKYAAIKEFANIGISIFGFTPLGGDSHGEQILTWLKFNKSDHIVILDDSSDINKLSQYLVHINPIIGLAKQDIIKAKEILSLPFYF